MLIIWFTGLKKSINMNFRYKAILQNIFSKMPLGEEANYVFQRHISRSLPVSDNEFIGRVSGFYERFQAWQRAGVTTNSYFEFGSGWDLIAPLTFRFLGFQRLICVDLRTLIRPELIRHTLQTFHRLRHQLPFDVPDFKIPLKLTTDTLQQEFQIEYRSPVDAAHTDIAADSIDIIFSNNVLEHVPLSSILPIFQECCRTLKPGGLCDFVIDYQDHWSYFDRSIGIYNFLHYDESNWRKWNPSLHFQNRLRHCDFTNLIETSGLSIDEAIAFSANEADWQRLLSKGIADEFRNRYSDEELQVPVGLFRLSKGI